MVSVMRRVAAISAGPRSASPRGSRARSFWGFFGFSAMSSDVSRLPMYLVVVLYLIHGIHGGYQRPPKAASAAFLTSPRFLRGEVEIRGSEFRVRGKARCLPQIQHSR